jgi:hypothetical protein
MGSRCHEDCYKPEGEALAAQLHDEVHIFMQADETRTREQVIAVYARHIVPLVEELEDWRDSAEAAAREECSPLDSHHCTCVGPMRKQIGALKDDNKRLREALDAHGEHDQDKLGQGGRDE